MQPMWISLLSGRRFDEAFENTRWRIAKKCSLCDFACADPSSLSKHLETHSGEKSNKCNQCDYACSDPSSLRKHMKRHSALAGKNKNNATSVTLPPFEQVIRGEFWKLLCFISQPLRLLELLFFVSRGTWTKMGVYIIINIIDFCFFQKNINTAL